jgi:transcriptional regulator with XRE-family HTH domain
VSDNLPEEHSRQIAEQIREELARRRMSREGLADQAKISISTLEKALSGRRPFTLATTIRLEEALGIHLRRKKASVVEPAADLAPPDLGSYSRAAVSWIEGDYLTLRPSFEEKKAIFAYRTEILWDGTRPGLVFRESERLDAKFSQVGAISVPHQSGHIYFVTSRDGQYRLIIVSRPTTSGEMYGILATLQVVRAQLKPISAPLALVPVAAVAELQFGQIGETHPYYACYRQYLQRTIDEKFVAFLPT